MLLGLPVVFGLGVFCVGGALVIGALGKRAADREVATGTVLALATGLGLLFNSLATKNSSTLTNVLFGNLLAITDRAAARPSPRCWWCSRPASAFIYRPLLFASVNAQVAEAKGVPVRGAVDPVHGAARPRRHHGRAGRRHAAAVRARRHPCGDGDHADAAAAGGDGVSTAISLVSVWLGLGVSAMFNLPPSFVIVTIACAVWLVVWAAQRGLRSSANRVR